MKLSLPACAAMLTMTFVGARAIAHQGPDPIAHWVFNSRTVGDDACQARLGPDLRLEGAYRIAVDASGESLDLLDWSRLTAREAESARLQPGSALTVAAWVLIDEPERWGGIAGQFGESGAEWVLGYNSDAFTFTIASEGAERPTEIVSKSPYAKGKWSYVVGVYDGESMQLYVNGHLEASSDEPEGAIAPIGSIDSTGSIGSSALVIASRPDHTDSHPLRGRLREVSVYDLAAKQEWVTHTFEHLRQLVNLQPDARGDALAMVVEPYLQFGTQDGMTVMWQTTQPGTSTVHYGETDACEESLTGDDALIHEVRLEGLQPETMYFYRVETTGEDGQSIGSDVSTFTTAVREGTPFAFAIISDTQFNPVVSGKLSELAWAQRPSFLLHPGDLVDTGTNDTHWTQHFFPGMRPLISRVPFYPVLGNHEQNASNYFEYVSVPSPEYYYDFRYGDAHFFMIDTNRNVDPTSEQYRWLDKALGESKATWKFACHHHPPYSSDEDDYGNLWKQNKSTRGDLRARELSTLYEKHGIDIVWNGHIHSYERTWPVRENKAVSSEGPIYMIVGGGGGNLESPGPTRPFFQNQVRRSHHYVMVHLNGETLELRSYDLDDRLFDTVRLEKGR
jgi:predicted phosphodiesterase